MSMSHILIVAVILIIFILGPAKLPQLGRGLGDAIRGFKKGMSGEDENEIDVTNSTVAGSEKLTESEWRARQEQKQSEKNKV